MNGMPEKKFFVVFLFLIFALTAAPLVSRSDAPETGHNTSLALSDFAVPEGVGKVQERFVGSSGQGGRVIIQVQDVHAHVTAQENIAAILERLRTVFGIKTVALEGAWITTSLPKSQAIPTSREKQLLASSLLSDDLIPGPAYAAIMSREPIELAGIENAGLYKKNRELFLAHLDQTKAIAEKLEVYNRSIRDAEQSAWGPELLAFGTAFGKFRETSDLGQFFPLLLKTAGAQAVDFSDLGQIVLLKNTLALEKTLAKEKLQQEINQLIRQYRGAPWTVEELIRGGKVPPEKLGLYPEIMKMKRLFEMRDKVSLKDLTDQIGALTDRVLGKLIATSGQKGLWGKAERFYLSKRLLSLAATPADLEDIEKEQAIFEAELSGAGLTGELALALGFYDAVKKRDKIFFDKIMNDPALAGNIAVVTGGFHTDGLSARFRKTGVSYITVAPELGGKPANEKLYAERMQNPLGQAPAAHPQKSGFQKAEDQTLAEPKNEQFARLEDFFPPAVDELKRNNNLTKALAFYRGEPITLSSADRTAARIGRGNRLRGAIDVSELRKLEFTELPRPVQLQKVRAVLELEPVSSGRVKAALVTDVDAVKKLFALEKVPELVRQLIRRGDFLVLPKGEPPVTGQLPEELLLSTHGVKFIKAADLKTLVANSQEFRQFAKNHPHAVTVMTDGESPNPNFVTFPVTPEAFVLYWLVAQDEYLYRAARNPEFLELLRSLVAEILSQELPKKSV